MEGRRVADGPVKWLLVEQMMQKFEETKQMGKLVRFLPSVLLRITWIVFGRPHNTQAGKIGSIMECKTDENGPRLAMQNGHFWRHSPAQIANMKHEIYIRKCADAGPMRFFVALFIGLIVLVACDAPTRSTEILGTEAERFDIDDAPWLAAGIVVYLYGDQTGKEPEYFVWANQSDPTIHLVGGDPDWGSATKGASGRAKLYWNDQAGPGQLILIMPGDDEFIYLGVDISYIAAADRLIITYAPFHPKQVAGAGNEYEDYAGRLENAATWTEIKALYSEPRRKHRVYSSPPPTKR